MIFLTKSVREENFNVEILKTISGVFVKSLKAYSNDKRRKRDSFR